MQKKTYSFRVYALPRAVIALLIFGGLLSWASVSIDLPPSFRFMPEVLLKGLIIGLIITFFLLIKRLIVQTVTVEIDHSGVHFQDLPGFWSFSAIEPSAFWNDIEAWRLTEGHVSLHTFAPQQFALTTTSGQRIRFFPTDDPGFTAFLSDFDTHLQSTGARHGMPVKGNIPTSFQQTMKVVIMVCTAALGIVSLTAPLWQPEHFQKREADELYSVLGIGIFLMAISVGIGWGLYKKTSG